MSESVKTTCPYCGVGCGVVVSRNERGEISVRGDETHPSNFGKLCSKGAALADTLQLDHRLLYPRVRGERATWDDTISTTASRFRQVIEQYGPDAVAFYVSGQLLTEDYYVANKLIKGFIGTGNIDTNSRLCMASSVAGHKRAFGADSVPCSYEDLEQADLVTLVGSNTAWCHPVLYQRIRDAKARRPAMKVVVIDPRRTATCDIADIHLSLSPGTDIHLFHGLLDYLARQGGLNWPYINQYTEGFEKALEISRCVGDPVEETAASCGVDPSEFEQFFRLFLATEKCVTVYSQGVNQWSYGTDKVNAIINCHLATGRIGQPGMGPFSFTGQPNAMGGREVGGLANQLAAHMDFEPADIERVSRFWKASRMATQPGLKAVDMFDAMLAGQIKAVWIMATNPVVSMPNAQRVRQALERCDFVAVSDCVDNTDTAKYADVLFPATTWGEKSGTVTNSERRISRQRGFVPAPGEARHDWQIVSDVARSMLGSAEAFPYTSVDEIFREYAQLSGLDNNGTRDFDISAFAEISAAQYDNLQPTQWPVTAQNSGGTARLLSDGRFFTRSGKARFVAVAKGEPANTTDSALPLALNTGRIRDQWHTMTRTGSAPRLCQHIPEPFVEIHPEDAEKYNLRDGMLARVCNGRQTITARATVTEEQRPGAVFVPMHWSGATAKNSGVNQLVGPAVDPISGQPEFKHSPVFVEPYHPRWQGLLFIESAVFIEEASYFSKIRGKGFWRYEMAGDKPPEDWLEWFKPFFPEDAEFHEFTDVAQQSFRFAAVNDSRLLGCLYIARSPLRVDREWLGSMFDKPELSPAERNSLLAARPLDPANDCGKTVCACFSVGEKTILNEIEQSELFSVEAIGEKLKAGTNCGSCIPELKVLLCDVKSS